MSAQRSSRTIIFRFTAENAEFAEEREIDGISSLMVYLCVLSVLRGEHFLQSVSVLPRQVYG
jgi:hypothetical protein